MLNGDTPELILELLFSLKEAGGLLGNQIYCPSKPHLQ